MLTVALCCENAKMTHGPCYQLLRALGISKRRMMCADISIVTCGVKNRRCMVCADISIVTFGVQNKGTFYADISIVTSVTCEVKSTRTSYADISNVTFVVQNKGTFYAGMCMVSFGVWIKAWFTSMCEWSVSECKTNE